MDNNYPKQIKKLILGQAITLPLVAAIIKIIYWGGDFFFVYLWFFVLVFTIFMMIVYPGTGLPKLFVPIFSIYNFLIQNFLEFNNQSRASEASEALVAQNG